MVVTESKALQFVANEELAGRIPSLSAMHQSFLRTKRDVAARTGCSTCSMSEPEFATLKERAFAHIRNLPEKDLEILKNHLVVSKLIFYEMRNGERNKITR